MSTNNDELIAILRKLKLHYLSEHLGDFVALATKKNMAVMQIIEILVAKELEETKRRSNESRLKAAKIGLFKAVADFDWNWPKKIPRTTVEQLLTLSFVEEPANAILVGSAGLGKTMLAKNIAYQTVLAGHSVLFTEAGDMLADLGSQDSLRALKSRITKYLRPKLLVIDELGYLSYSNRSADLLFQVITQRYEKTATLITTNKPFKEWDSVFPGAGCVSPLIDRLTHHAEIIVIEGPSYRCFEAGKRKTKTKGDEHEKRN